MRIRKILFYCCVLPALLSVAGHASALELTPITALNSLPITQGVGLPAAPPAELIEYGGLRFSVNGAVQSHANDTAGEREALVLDGEVHTLAVNLVWGFATHWQASLSAGTVRHTGGELDSVIDTWHEWFDLDSGDRSRQTRDQLLFSYNGPNEERRITASQSGRSDTSLGLSRQVAVTENWRLAIHAHANLPTGSANVSFGSNNTDIALSISAAYRNSTTIGWHANVGLLRIGDDMLFGIPTKRDVWFGSIGAHWEPSPRWRWSAQIDAHSSMLVSALDEINQPAWQLAVGGQRRWGQQGPLVQLYFTEDLSVNRAADFGLGLNVRFDL